MCAIYGIGMRNLATEWLMLFRYSRHLQVVEMYVRLCKEESVWEQLDDNVKEFLRDVSRNYHS